MNNIAIAYFLAFFKNTWFWLGIWVFYYLRFTNYAGIGLIETVLIVTYTLSEIPTGAIADLIGKKRTLILSFLLETIGSIIMSTSTGLNSLLISVFIMCLGGALYSGTIDALVYDSLKEKGQEKDYDKKISNLNTIQLLAPAICSIIGGFLYVISPTFPFWANTIGYFIGLMASLFLKEPRVDTIKFSFKNFLAQNTKGLSMLFQNSIVKKQTLLLLSVGFFVVISSEMLDSFLGLEFGFREEAQGVLWAVIFIISAAASQLTPFIRKLLMGNLSIYLVGSLMAITFVLSPVAGMLVGGLTLTLRSCLQGIFGNLASITLNDNVESKYRATTISTFNMIKNIPYLLTAYVVGSISDIISAKSTALILGIMLLVLLVAQIVSTKQKHKLSS